MLTAEQAHRTRRAGLSLVPLGAVVVAVAAAVLYALTLPSSSSSSDRAVMLAVIVLWVLSIAFLAISAMLISTVSPRQRRVVASGIALILAAAGWWVSRRLDHAWVDACDSGTGSGNRCLGGGGSAPGWVLLLWPAFGLLIGGLCAGVAVIARESTHAQSSK